MSLARESANRINNTQVYERKYGQLEEKRKKNKLNDYIK